MYPKTFQNKKMMGKNPSDFAIVIVELCKKKINTVNVLIL